MVFSNLMCLPGGWEEDDAAEVGAVELGGPWGPETEPWWPWPWEAARSRPSISSSSLGTILGNAENVSGAELCLVWAATCSTLVG